MTRSEEVKTERRRRRGDNVLLGQKLGVSEEFLDRANFEYRWINDDGRRIQQRTVDDDWDLVEDPAKQGKPDADGLGTKVSKVVNTRGEGGPMNAYLARKPKEFYDEDQRAKRDRNDALMQPILKGQVVPDGAAPLGVNGYVPNGPTGIQIKDSRR